jgi:hypothetical protein
MSFFAIAYLFVGLSHATAHVDETLANLNKTISTTISLEMSLAATDGFDDSDSEKLSADGEYCQVYAPALMSVLARVAVPAAQFVELVFAAPRLLVEDHHWLDTPPPKQLT